jgi:SsrA-binding protein
VVCRNKRAFHEYEISDTLECGLVLTGTEVKSLREGSGSLEDAYAKIEGGEVWLLGSDIPEYSMGNRMNHKPKRPRKLLLHRREIGKFAGKASQRGFTLVPLKIYFKGSHAKVELAVARGKQLHDKRQSQKKADAQREIRRAMSDRRR